MFCDLVRIKKFLCCYMISKANPKNEFLSNIFVFWKATTLWSISPNKNYKTGFGLVSWQQQSSFYVEYNLFGMQYKFFGLVLHFFGVLTNWEITGKCDKSWECTYKKMCQTLIKYCKVYLKKLIENDLRDVRRNEGPFK